MKKFITFTLLTLACACEKPEPVIEDYFNLTTTSFVVESSSSTVSIPLSTNIAYDYQIPEWTELVRQTFTFLELSVSPNRDLEPRSGDVIFTANGTLLGKVTIQQMGSNPYINTSVQNLEFLPDGGMTSITVDANVNYSVECSPWLSVTSDGTNVLISSEPNYHHSRQGYLSLKSDSVTTTLEISQPGFGFEHRYLVGRFQSAYVLYDIFTGNSVVTELKRVHSWLPIKDGVLVTGYGFLSAIDYHGNTQISYVDENTQFLKADEFNEFYYLVERDRTSEEVFLVKRDKELNEQRRVLLTVGSHLNTSISVNDKFIAVSSYVIKGPSIRVFDTKSMDLQFTLDFPEINEVRLYDSGIVYRMDEWPSQYCMGIFNFNTGLNRISSLKTSSFAIVGDSIYTPGAAIRYHESSSTSIYINPAVWSIETGQISEWMYGLKPTKESVIDFRNGEFAIYFWEKVVLIKDDKVIKEVAVPGFTDVIIL